MPLKKRVADAGGRARLHTMALAAENRREFEESGGKVKNGDMNRAENEKNRRFSGPGILPFFRGVL
jgi:hypothetical protein